ncbi:MAG: CHRD domain-containing protein [Actinomycetota bacterium]|nr:CHRD domain-containing protein [Actinomycetota bacterium]
MVGTRMKMALGGALLLLAGAAASADAGGGAAQQARLNSFAEVPTLVTAGAGTFQASVDQGADRIRFTLQFRGVSSRVQQAHIHIGRTATNGGIAAFLCSNLPGAPAGTPACPARRGTVTGTIVPARVLGPADQGIAAGEFDRLVRALRVGAAYVNVHTANFTSGEIRGQIR